MFCKSHLIFTTYYKKIVLSVTHARTVRLTSKRVTLEDRINVNLELKFSLFITSIAELNK